MSSQAPNGEGPVVIAVNGAAVAAIVLGVVAIPVAFLPLIGVVLGGLLGLAGVATGIVGRRRAADDTDPHARTWGWRPAASWRAASRWSSSHCRSWGSSR